MRTEEARLTSCKSKLILSTVEGFKLDQHWKSWSLAVVAGKPNPFILPSHGQFPHISRRRVPSCWHRKVVAAIPLSATVRRLHVTSLPPSLPILSRAGADVSRAANGRRPITYCAGVQVSVGAAADAREGLPGGCSLSSAPNKAARH